MKIEVQNWSAPIHSVQNFSEDLNDQMLTWVTDDKYNQAVRKQVSE